MDMFLFWACFLPDIKSQSAAGITQQQIKNKIPEIHFNDRNNK